MELLFFGAVSTVTGSKYLIKTHNRNYLIDCGLFQGLKELRLRNWHKPEFEASNIDAVFLTHAHIDHSGYIPRLVKQGFKGKIYCSIGTFELCKILLPDSGYLHEEEARYANQMGYSKHKPALPLYTKGDAEYALNYFQPIDFHKSIKAFNDTKVTFLRAGHILGASSVLFESQSRKIIFSGDVGRYNDLIMRPPEPLPNADYLVIESTYGDRLHDDKTMFNDIATVINECAKKNGTIIIPSFAVGRAQHMLHILQVLKEKKQIPPLKTYLDSPMAIDATNLYCKHHNEHRLSDDECKTMCQGAILTHTANESKEISKEKSSKIIISASGMATGGRVLHHLAAHVEDPNNAVLFVGYQAAGTRGRDMVEGAKQIKMFGKYYTIKAKIKNIPGLSAHADYKELIRWLNESNIKNPKVFITHGEQDAAKSFLEKLKNTFHWNVKIPIEKKEYTL